VRIVRLNHDDSNPVSENSVNFKRKKIRGQNAKTKRTWMDDDGNYRITWSTDIAGIKMDAPVIHACVFTDWGWGFAGKRGPYKTVKAAKQACEFNKELWDAFLSMEGRDKIAQYNVLRHKSMVGSGKSAVSAMSDIPLWVLGLADERQLSIICPKRKGDECDYQDDPTPISNISDASTHGQSGESQSSTPVPDAPVKAARRATAREKGRKKNSKPSTTKRSGTGKTRTKRSTSTTSSSRRSRQKKEKS
jgi:hypothetical protein